MLFNWFLIKAIILFSWFAVADDKLPLDKGFPIEAQITFGTLDRSYELILNDHSSDLPLKTQIAHFSSYEVYMDSMIVRIESLDEERVRIHLPMTLNLLLVPKKNVTDYFEKVFKSFVIQTDANLAATLTSLKPGKYIVSSPSALQEMRDFIELAKQQGPDAAIKRFASSSYTPPVQQVYQVGFFADVLQMGLPQGIHVGHFHLFANNVTLPTHRFNSPGYTSEHRHLQMSDVQHVFEKNDPLLVEYFSVMEQLRVRIGVLEKRGWLEGLWKSHAKDVDIDNTDSNVVPLTPFGACQRIF